MEKIPFLFNDMDPVGGGRGPEAEPVDWRFPLDDEGVGDR